MPRKRTHAKRRMDAWTGAKAWADVFRAGFAVFDDFTDETGVETGPNGRVPLEAAAAAWGEYGSAFLELYGHETAPGRPSWAIEQFGEPAHAR